MSKLIQQVLDFIQDTEGKIFSIRFTKRTTNETREMTCRTGVKKYLAKEPKKAGISFRAHDLIPVYDMHAPDPEKGYRSIPIEGITEIKMHGEWEPVSHEPRWRIRIVDVRENKMHVWAKVDGLNMHGVIHELSTEEWASLAKLVMIDSDSSSENGILGGVRTINPLFLPFDMYGRIDKP